MTEHAVVVGGGIGGLGTALALSRVGVQVTLVERDDTPTPTDVNAAFDWDRRGAPQVRHPHVFLARLHHILRDRYPDVIEALVEAGVEERNMLELFGEGMADGDDEFTVVPCRRTTIEWVLRRVVLSSELVDIRVGVGVQDVLAEPGADGGPPRVTGVRLEDGTEITADLVVAATGRRGDVPELLAPIGVEIPETVADAGMIYFSRFYRLSEGHEVPPFGGGRQAGVTYAVIAADNGYFSTTLTAAPNDRELRNHFKDDDGYEATLRLFSELDSIHEPGFCEPLTPVHQMSGLINRIRRFTDKAGDPLVLGFHAVGDAHTCTNPAYGRGCSLAMVQATMVADVVTEHPGDPLARGRAYEAACVQQIEPWYHLSVMTDEAFGSMSMDEEINPEEQRQAFFSSLFGTPGPGGGEVDPVLAKAMMRVANLLATPMELMSDPAVMAKIAEMTAALSAPAEPAPVAAAQLADRPKSPWADRPKPRKVTRASILATATTAA